MCGVSEIRVFFWDGVNAQVYALAAGRHISDVIFM